MKSINITNQRSLADKFRNEHAERVAFLEALEAKKQRRIIIKNRFYTMITGLFVFVVMVGIVLLGSFMDK